MYENIKVVPVSKKLKNYKEIIEVYENSFPKSERFSPWLLRLMAHRKGFDFFAYYDGDTFCGLSYNISNDTDVFGLYMAVNKKERSKGYGAMIHDKCIERAAGRRFNSTVEPLDDQADNAEERRKRIRFHERNGNRLTGYGMTQGGDYYWLMVMGGEFDPKAFRKLLKRMTFGLYAPKIEKVEEHR